MNPIETISESAGIVPKSNAFVALTAVALVGMAAVVCLRRFPRIAAPESADGQAAFTAYLRDHMTGADAAIELVEELADHGDARDGPLFGRLLRELREDRDVVSALLVTRGGSQASVQRIAGWAGGAALRVMTRGRRGELALFRSLEGLSAGIQGKRCLWRTGQTLEPAVRAPGQRSFAELEARAIRQWDAVEEYRRSLARVTFASGKAEVGRSSRQASTPWC